MKPPDIRRELGNYTFHKYRNLAKQVGIPAAIRRMQRNGFPLEMCARTLAWNEPRPVAPTPEPPSASGLLARIAAFRPRRG